MINDPAPEFTQVNSTSQLTQLNPSLSAGMQKNFGRNMSAGLFLGRAQRSGSLTEKYINYFPVGQDPYEMLGNPMLDPEVNNQADLTFEWKTGNTLINIDLFAAYMQNFISSVKDTTLSPRLPMSPGVRQFINIDKAFKTGLELNWVQKLPWGMQHQLGLAYTYAQDLERSEPLAEIPPMDLRYTLKGSYFNEKLVPELAFRYVLKQSRISEEFGETASPSFANLDVKLTYNISAKLKLNAGVSNIFDNDYYEHLSRSVRGTKDPILAPGRNFFAGVSLVF
mgnify:CR=1 FL=1